MQKSRGQKIRFIAPAAEVYASVSRFRPSISAKCIFSLLNLSAFAFSMPGSQMVSPQTSIRLSLCSRALPDLRNSARACAGNLPARIYRPRQSRPRRKATITGVQGDAIQLTLPNGKTAIPSRARPSAWTPPLPPSYARRASTPIMSAVTTRRWPTSSRIPGDTYRGLPTDWAQQTLAALGNIYLEKNDISQGRRRRSTIMRKLLSRTRQATNSSLSIAQARIAFAKNNAAQAKPATRRHRPGGAQGSGGGHP